MFIIRIGSMYLHMHSFASTGKRRTKTSIDDLFVLRLTADFRLAGIYADPETGPKAYPPVNVITAILEKFAIAHTIVDVSQLSLTL